MPQVHMRGVGLIGYGAIAEAVCLAAHQENLPLNAVIVRPARRNEVQAALPGVIRAVDTLNALTADTRLVIECAGHQAVRQYGCAVLERGLDLAILSSGALADAELCAAVMRAARTHDAQLRILSGAIGGIDALSAAGSHLTGVHYAARKPPLSWAGTPAEEVVDLHRVTEPTPVFKGTAREAALKFPKNANVVATVALAGIGFDRTDVVLYADPTAQGNSHEIAATGGGYDFSYRTVGAALPSNPKTSALTAQSVVRAVRHQASGLLI